ncbi:uncharacterized protein LOC113391366 [Vanessa tameamea]|uniref:Uncharacterized protein LOC113391366 n=1 Tax=Vanessa tameamea TaxID=334116 RepID=A0ABM4AXZ5_VANTA
MVFYLIKVLFEFLFYIVLFSRPEHRNHTSGVNKRVTDENEKMELPEVNVECKYLPTINDDIVYGESSKLFNKAYEIDGFVFTEEPFRRDDILQEFEIQNVRENAKFNDTDVRSNVLRFAIQETPYGIIINSNILVTDNNYHTIISDQEKCIVCDMQAESPGEHIKLDTHKANLEKYKPLNEYDGVIRKIDEEYYCSVCNRIFNKTLIDEHYNGKDHEDKTLYAINRASDVLDNFNLNNDKNEATAYHFDRNNVAWDASDETCNVDDCCVTSNVTNNNVINNVSGNSSDNGSDSSSRKLSYASIAKTPSTPKYIDIILNGQNVQVKFDAWHMILTTTQNKFTCMVCVGFYHISQKTKHCSDQTHLDKLSECETVKKYPKHIIRKINDRFYHCGNCNKLQLSTDIDDHVDFVHLKKQKTTQNNVIQTNENNEKNDVKNNVVSRNDRVIFNESNRNENQMPLNQNASMILSCYFIYVNQFYFTLRVSLISYNMVYKRPNDYHCFKCNCVLPELGMRRHIHEQSHIEKMAFTPFEPYFGVNLIRLINTTYHCCNCNVIVTKDNLTAHLTWQALHETKVDKKQRKIDLKSGIKQIDIELKKESFYTSNNESDIVILTHIEVKPNKNICLKKANKIIVYNDNAVKVSWDAWQSIYKKIDGYRCYMCQADVKNYEINAHISDGRHIYLIENTFERNYLPHLLRKVDENILNCLTCNMLVSSKEHIISKHINGKKHKDINISLKVNCANIPDSSEVIFKL